MKVAASSATITPQTAPATAPSRTSPGEEPGDESSAKEERHRHHRVREETRPTEKKETTACQRSRDHPPGKAASGE
ncbi:hypothetical protein [Methanoculleus chikugoensis]|uniref:hypothetical protein n=1 Tax=Methanoculleus chikugoensis TaxID=118126 RepID=UPI0006D20EE2|nr:hypothetical protein [Methanoculleus chikugoensis]